MSTFENGLEILDKANAVITALEQHPTMTVAQIAEITGEPVSSTYRLLTSLTSIGWVNPGLQRGQYRLGLGLMITGSAVEEHINPRTIATPVLRSLLATTGATSYLCVLRGTRAVCIERFDGPDVQSLALQLGASLPLYAGAAPRTILAFLPPADREAVLSSLPATHPGGETHFSAALEAGDPQPVNRTDLDEELARVRAKGYAISDQDVTPGIAAIGAPIFNHRGELEAAISISGLRARILDNAMIQAVLDAASRVSAGLGYLKDKETRHAP